MTSQRRRDTAPELALRRVLHGRGLRFRVDFPVPAGTRRRGDVVFPYTFVFWPEEEPLVQLQRFVE